ncbi:MAG: YraN family protein [Burkholderiales bacterium]|nr:MAG: YraN family protein [Burkholderiales bacterium]
MGDSAKGQSAPGPGRAVCTKDLGDRAEALALEHLQRQGLVLVRRNFRTPGRGGGEIDLIMREPDGTLVFVEVRQRASRNRGGAAGSITAHKQRRIVFAARHFLHLIRSEPPCRFDVVLVEGDMGADSATPIRWLRAAFDASATF